MKAPMIMASGHIIEDVLNIQPSQVKIWDIAWSLSLQNRYAGHTPRAWSVISHLGLVYQLALQDTKGSLNPYDALGILLHDAAECYLSDVPRPIKRLPEFKVYLEHEEAVLRVICQAVGLNWDAVDWDLVYRYDDQALHVEMYNMWPHLRNHEFVAKPVYEQGVYPNLRLGLAKDFVDFLRPQVITLRSSSGQDTSGVNELFFLSETLKPYADPDAFLEKPAVDVTKNSPSGEDAALSEEV